MDITGKVMTSSRQMLQGFPLKREELEARRRVGFSAFLFQADRQHIVEKAIPTARAIVMKIEEYSPAVIGS